MAEVCPVGAERGLTGGEVEMVHAMFGTAIDTDRVTIRRRRWFFLQPHDVTMAPCGHIHFHPQSRSYCDDFAAAELHLQGLFIHEMTHVWQAQTHGRWYLPLLRHPFCRYNYSLKPGWPLARYGIEQQAEIVRHAFLLRSGAKVGGSGDARVYEGLVDFPGVQLNTNG